jgi:hypothetical protein
MLNITNNSSLDTNTELVRHFSKDAVKTMSSNFRHTLYGIRQIGKQILTNEEKNSQNKNARHAFCGFATHGRHVKIVKANKGKIMYNGVAFGDALFVV